MQHRAKNKVKIVVLELVLSKNKTLLHNLAQKFFVNHFAPKPINLTFS
jgi:hypothetical protein